MIEDLVVNNHLSTYSYSSEYVQFVRKVLANTKLLRVNEEGVSYSDISLSVRDAIELLEQIVQLSTAFGVKFIPFEEGTKYLLLATPHYKKVASCMVSVVRKNVKMGEFSPDCAVRVKVKGAPPVPPPPKFKPVRVHHSVPLALLKMEAKFKGCFNHPFTLGYWAKDGLTLSHVTGMRDDAYYNTICKFNNNKMAPSEDVMGELALATATLLRKVGVSKIDPIPLDLSFDHVYDINKGKDTSAGFLPFNVEQYYEGEITSRRKNQKKDVAYFVADMTEKYVASVKEYVHGRSTDPPLQVFVEMETQKYEILRWMEVYREDKLSEDFVIKCLEKVRIFYCSSAFNFAIDKTVFTPVSNAFKFYQNAIGVRVQDGGFQQIWDILTGGDTSPLRDKWEAAFEAFPELRERQYGEGDWQKYDFTLLAAVLACVAGMSVPFFTPDENIDELTLRYLLAEFVFNTVFKTVYINGLGSFYDIWGCMFSGKYITSIGDTLYQMILFMAYKKRVLAKYPSNKIIQLVMELEMCMFFFYGDDHVGGWPVYMNDYTLYDASKNVLDDFITFCTEIYGMQYKTNTYFVSSDPYSRVYFDKTVAGYKENLEHPDRFLSNSFLQNRLARVYMRNSSDSDYVYVGMGTYRETDVIFAKLSMSTGATRDPQLYQCLLISHAQLCSGNPEAYSAIFRLYEHFRSRYSAPDDDVWERFGKMKLGNSIAMLKNDFYKSFPSYHSLMARQREGYMNMQGFRAFDFLGQEGSPVNLFGSNDDPVISYGDVLIREVNEFYDNYEFDPETDVSHLFV